MIARPIPDGYQELRNAIRGRARAAGNIGGRVVAIWGWRPSAWSMLRAMLSSHTTGLIAVPGSKTIAGGGIVSFFRKDNNRTDAFQRQISGLRKQLQGDEGSATDEFRYGGSGSGQAAGPSSEGEETDSFTSPVGASRESRGDDTSYAPSRISEEIGGRTAAPAQSFRPTFQPADANTSVIATNAHWNGTMRTEGSVHI